jgi:hypothetical protein
MHLSTDQLLLMAPLTICAALIEEHGHRTRRLSITSGSRDTKNRHT